MSSVAAAAADLSSQSISSTTPEQFRNISLKQPGKMSLECSGTTAILIISGKIPEIVL